MNPTIPVHMYAELSTVPSRLNTNSDTSMVNHDAPTPHAVADDDRQMSRMIDGITKPSVKINPSKKGRYSSQSKTSVSGPSAGRILVVASMNPKVVPVTSETRAQSFS